MKNVNIFVFLSVDRPGIGNQKRVTDWRDMDLLLGSAHKKGRVCHGKTANVTCQKFVTNILLFDDTCKMKISYVKTSKYITTDPFSVTAYDTLVTSQNVHLPGSLTHICPHFCFWFLQPFYVGNNVQRGFWPFLAKTVSWFDPWRPFYHRPHMGTLGSRGYVFFPLYITKWGNVL